MLMTALPPLTALPYGFEEDQTPGLIILQIWVETSKNTF